MTESYASAVSDAEFLRNRIDSYERGYAVIKDICGLETAEREYVWGINDLTKECSDAFREGWIDEKRFRELLLVLNSAFERHMERAQGKEEKEIPREASKGEKSGTTGNSFRTGDLLTPDNLDDLPVFSAARGRFIAPETVDLRDYCLKTANQGDQPWCAAYSAAGFAENILWRKTDVPSIIDAAPLYRYAKEHDGSPKTDGTTLNAALEALLDKGYFDVKECSVKVLRTAEHVKYAIHKFGCCLLGMMVTGEWYDCCKAKSTISGKGGSHVTLGGHAVLCCGFTRDGVIIQNSWGVEWGAYGFALITWNEFERRFVYGAVMDNCLYNTKMN